MKRKTKLLLLVLIILMSMLALNYNFTASKLKSKIISSSVDTSPGIAPEGTYPLILLHGFNPTYSRRIAELSLQDMQNSLSADLGYLNRELLTPETTCAELRYSKSPIVIRATYFNKLQLVEIDEYANNVADIISKVKFCTGAEKVDVLTHSMGGIVARYYIKEIDSSSIRKLIMLGTPNHGGLYKIGEVANFLVSDGKSKINLDFVELSGDHNFMESLNQGDETVGEVEYYTVAGNIDRQGDGLILAKSVGLDGSKDHIEVSCNHIALKHPKVCPEGYDFVKEVLR